MKYLQLNGMKRGMFLSLSTFQFLRFVRWGVFYSFMYLYLYDLMGSVTLTALLGTFNMIASTLGQNLIWGRISDKYKIRAKLIVVGESLAGFFYIGVFYLHRYFLYASNSFTAGLVIIFGLSSLEFLWSMSDVGWAALLAETTKPDFRGTAMGILNFVGSIGRLIGIGFAGFLYNGGAGFSGGTIFYVVSAMLFSGSLVMLISSRIEKSASIETEATESFENDKKERRLYLWFFFSLAVVVLGATSINQVFLVFLGFAEGLNANDAEISLILTMWTIGGMIASVLSGRLADKIGRGKILLYGFVLASTTPLIYGFVPSPTIMALVYGLSGVASWTVQTVGFALISDLIPGTHRGRLFSIYNAIMSLAWGPAGLLIGGPLTDAQIKILGYARHSACVNTFMVSTVLTLAGTILFFLKVERRYSRDKPEQKKNEKNWKR